MCDWMNGDESKLVDFYLRDGEFVNGEPAGEFGYYSYDEPDFAPANYSGPVQVQRKFRFNHSCDDSLYNEGGGLKCTSVSLEVLLQHNLLNYPGLKVLDIHGATENRCEDTDDGHHYHGEHVVRRQLTLLLRGMQQSVAV